MVVRMRHTRSHTKNRRSHHRVSSVRISKDENGVPHVRHRMNPTTGKYRGRDVVDVVARSARKTAKKTPQKV
jgi:ribosomal protein L32